MDDLTRERYGWIPWRELRANPGLLPRAKPSIIAERRIALCGTADLGVIEHGGGLTRVGRDLRLTRAIRSYSA